MNSSWDLCQLLASELFPRQSYFKTQIDDERDDEKRLQILYSAAGLHMLASVYDHDEENDGSKSDGSVSMIHVLKRGERVIRAFDDLYDNRLFDRLLPPKEKEYPLSGEENEQAYKDLMAARAGRHAYNIRDLFLKTGYVRHRSRRLLPAAVSCGRFEDILCLRGHLPWLHNSIKISGLGLYKKAPNPPADCTCISVQEQFCLEAQSPLDWWRSVSSAPQWSETAPERVEYFNLRRRTVEKYWSPDRSILKGVVSLFRTRLDYGPFEYGLVSEVEGKLQFCHLPEGVLPVCYPPPIGVKNDTMRIALALMKEQGIAYHARIKKGAELSWVSLDWMLPRREQDFFELYSWPEKTQNSHWHRLFSNDLLPFILHMLENPGFIIQEA